MSFKCFAEKDMHVICKTCKYVRKLKKGDHVILGVCKSCESKGWFIKTDIFAANVLSSKAYFSLIEIPEK